MSAKCQKRTSLDHLVGAGEESVRDVETKCLGRLKIEHQFNLAGWTTADSGLLSLQDATHIYADLMIHLECAGAIAHKAAIHGFSPPIHRRSACRAACSTSCFVRVQEKRASANQNRSSLSFNDVCKRTRLKHHRY